MPLGTVPAFRFWRGSTQQGSLIHADHLGNVRIGILHSPHLARRARQRKGIPFIPLKYQLIVIDGPAGYLKSDRPQIGDVALRNILIPEQDGLQPLKQLQPFPGDFILLQDSLHASRDYYFSDLVGPDNHRPIGKWGWMHQAYLREHKPGLYIG